MNSEPHRLSEESKQKHGNRKYRKADVDGFRKMMVEQKLNAKQLAKKLNMSYSVLLRLFSMDY